MVKNMKRLSRPRLFSFSAQCAMVIVTPEESSSRVLSAGRPQAAMGVNFSAKPGPAEGQCAVNPGQSVSLWSRLARSGTDTTRSQKSVPKNAAKNITSEKMNQLIPQRNERSTFLEYRLVSDSWITSPNQRKSMYRMMTTPRATEIQPARMSLNAKIAPRTMQYRPTDPMIGHAIGWGMK